MLPMKKETQSEENIGIVLKEIIGLEKKMDFSFSDLHKDFNEFQGSVGSKREMKCILPSLA